MVEEVDFRQRVAAVMDEFKFMLLEWSFENKKLPPLRVYENTVRYALDRLMPIGTCCCWGPVPPQEWKSEEDFDVFVSEISPGVVSIRVEPKTDYGHELLDRMTAAGMKFEV